MRRGLVLLALPLALGVGGCGESPTAPALPPAPDGALSQRVPSGSLGLVLDNFTGVSLPIVGTVDELVVHQAVINEIVLGEVVGGVVGLTVTGTIEGLVVSALGTRAIEEEFTSELGITPGAGGCKIVTLELSRLNVDGLGLVGAEVNSVAVEGNGSGAVGSLLCALGNVLSGVVGGATGAVEGILRTLNRLI